MAEVMTVTKENFDDVIANNRIVAIDFWASWCAPCKNFAPILENAATRHSDVLFASVNVEEQTELANEFDIRSIPFLMILKDSTLIYAEPGALSAAEFNDLIERAKVVAVDDK
ncbi:MAG: thioredoxin family protein [Pseudomonadota bacterium]|nr:thioredoxin family protein [Pseudomonadota bacterium]